MTQKNQSIFRASALKYYIQGQEKDVLPHLVSPPIFVFFWLLLGLLMIGGCVAWWGEVPTFVAGSGIILEKEPRSISGQNNASALIFLPAYSSLTLGVGNLIQLQVDVTGRQYAGRIEKVEPGIISPFEARKRYALDGSASQVITLPSIVVLVRLGPLSTRLYAGSIVRARVQVGSRRVLLLLPGFDQLIGGREANGQP